MYVDADAVQDQEERCFIPSKREGSHAAPPNVTRQNAIQASAECTQRTFFFKIFFFMSAIFKVFIEFATLLLLLYVLAFWFRGAGDLSSLTRDRTCTSCTGR